MEGGEGIVRDFSSASILSEPFSRIAGGVVRRGKTKSTLSTETRPSVGKPIPLRRGETRIAFPVNFRTVPPSAPVVSGYILSTSQVTSIRDKFVRETEVPVIRLFSFAEHFLLSLFVRLQI